MRILLIAILVSLLLAPVRGQTAPGVGEFDEKAKSGIEYVYNLEFEKAENEFRGLTRLRPGDPAGYALLAMVDWWRILIDIDNTGYDDRFYGQLDKVIDMCDELLERNENDVNALFFKGGAIGFKGRLKFHRDDWIAAANAGRKALPIVQSASAADPKNYDILLGTGIYDYYAEVIPEEYPVVKPLLLFIPRGDKKRGIQELTTAAEKGKYACVEAAYFLLQIYYLYEKDYGTALSFAQDLHQRFPDNMLFHKYVGRCYVSLGNWPLVDQLFSEIVQKARSGARGYGASTEREAEYYLGMVDLLGRRYDSALNHFFRCDELSRGLDKNEVSGFMVMTNLKAGMVYDLLARRDHAVTQYKKVLGMKEYKDSHHQANQFLKTPYAQ